LWPPRASRRSQNEWFRRLPPGTPGR
jgi:hypothetical protein